MNRRKAIGRIVLAGLGGGLLFSGYKWYDWHKTPDLLWLQSRKDLVSALADSIIPATTDSPGAHEAGVADYILLMIRDATDRVSMNKFIDGLKELDHYCHSHYDHSFEQCSASDQYAVLMHFEEKARPFNTLIGKIEYAYLGLPFFTTLKKYTVEGYCTSEAGATKGLRYLPVPGHYAGCIPLTPGQKAWATR
jgi:hypothetical protein